MSFEGGPTPEQIREAYIINEMKSVSPEQMMKFLQGDPDPANAIPREQQQELHSWLDEGEEKRNELQEGSSEWAEYIVNFELKRAELYRLADMPTMEIITLEDLKPLAENYGLIDEVSRIEKRLSELVHLEG
jgi:hypothetical protein